MQNSIIVIGNNEALSALVQKFLFEKGWSWYDDEKRTRHESQEAIAVFTDKRLEVASEQFYRTTTPFKTYEFYNANTDMGRFVDAFTIKPIRVKLTDEYTAEISPDKKTVKVGCTTFDAERVKEVAKALES